MTLEQKLQAVLGAQALTIIKLETAVDELQTRDAARLVTINDLDEQLSKYANEDGDEADELPE